MNIEMFDRLYLQLFQENKEILDQIRDTNDEIGTVLRIHLICEQFLEIYICSICNQEKLFCFQEKANSEEQKITISFDHKLKMAKSLKLPDWGYNIFVNVNTIRNRLAHRINGQIDYSRLESILSFIKSDVEPLIPFHKHFLDKFSLPDHSEESGLFKFLNKIKTSEPRMTLVLSIYYTLIFLNLKIREKYETNE
ncbi:hypothetical protein [Neisseria sicca]|uniref:hypothetical protein n=1 Tax=Neisseria sicca TaxID=490 RepID=UPI0036103679